jgi:hypothetical protein
MPAYNFKAKFADAVRTGRKRQTIRKPRKRPTVCGDYLKLYTGMRTKQCELLVSTYCLSVTPIKIHEDAIEMYGTCLSWMDIEIMAHDDGFASPAEFFAFFKSQYGELPIEMELIRWL